MSAHSIPKAEIIWRSWAASRLKSVPDRAIEIAKRSGVPLKIAAKVDDADVTYFKAEIEPLLDHPLIEFLGEIDESQKCQFLGKARALLFPIDWPEPFGLVMIEAMSAGTPVIAWRKGSVAEVVTDRVSGVIVNSIEAAVAAVKESATMSRAAVRAEFETRFTVARMARDYVDAYRSLLARASSRTEFATSAKALTPKAREHVALRTAGVEFAREPGIRLNSQPTAESGGRLNSISWRTYIGGDMHEAERGVDHVMDAAIELSQHYIETETSLVQRALRSLKHEDAFAVFDDYGDIGVGRAGPEGVYSTTPVSSPGTNSGSRGCGRSS